MDNLALYHVPYTRRLLFSLVDEFLNYNGGNHN